MNFLRLSIPGRTALIALSVGFFLGHAVLQMAQQRPGWLGLAIALVFVSSATASFVLYALSLRSVHTKAARSHETYRLLGAVGAGLLAAMHWLA